MKKLFICALILSALASCKKQEIEPETTALTIDLRCSSCSVSYTDAKGENVHDVVKGSLVVTYRAKVGGVVNVSMRNKKPGNMVMTISSSSGLQWWKATGDGYPCDLLFYSSVVIK